MTRRTPLARRAVAAAEAHLGEPYALGGIGPRKWDCRGLADHALHCARVLPRNQWPLSAELYSRYAAHAVTVAEAIKLEGALLFWQRKDGSILHVALSRGDGTVIHAAGTPGIGGEPKVCVARLEDYPERPTRACDPFA
jgi:cell wall-associated NlpC family hydrolase